MQLPPEVRVFPGHTDETTIGREWEENPFVRVWRGVDPEGTERFASAAARRRWSSGRRTTTARGRRWVRFEDGREAIVGGSGVERTSWPSSSPTRSSGTPRRTRARPRSSSQRLAEETRATLELPAMLTGPIEGRFLELLVFARGARRVLELGTYSGYSSISMAAALPAGGRIDTCEVDERHAAVARRYIAEAGYADRITVHLGPALETIGRLEGEFDFVFIDADKENYVNYYEAVLPRLSERGLIAADNTLWSGRVVDEAETTPRRRAPSARSTTTFATTRGWSA